MKSHKLSRLISTSNHLPIWLSKKLQRHTSSLCLKTLISLPSMLSVSPFK
ncbi:hypothetical protein PILCRDRAFT_775967 [Piloderma croceum F 1598]|uniref:Uncharacterized protein n=1 Tax=Piloderma croceum (strain F 1598) TaxID=765440 RepID=A0A0C3C893_PILCF|nr:hypothetical protein PILCRDRAFT_775967 [Piloderma croceum F 1598]